MTNQPLDREIAVEDIRRQLATLGVGIAHEEAASLAEQAAPYAAMLDRLVDVSLAALDPAVSFAIDDWVDEGDE